MSTAIEGRLAPVDRSYLRPAQKVALQKEKQRLERVMTGDPVYSRGVDKQEVVQRLRNVDREMRKQSAPPCDNPDLVRKRIGELEQAIKLGMPSAAEMRRNPDGAVDKHMAWEARNALNVQEWKNLKRQLEPDNDAADYTNITQLRPKGDTLNMHNEQIVAPTHHIPPNVEITNVMSDADRVARALDALETVEQLDASGQLDDPAMRKFFGLPPLPEKTEKKSKS